MMDKDSRTTWKQRVEQHPGLTIALVTIAGFVAGIGAYESVLRMAKLTTISQDRKDALEEQASSSLESVDGLPPMVWRMSLDLLVDDNTTAAWEDIAQRLSPLVVDGKRLVPLTAEMFRGTKTSEGELVVYWKQLSGSDKLTLKVAGSYREQIPIPDGGTIEQAWGIFGTSEQQYSRTRIEETRTVDVRIMQIGGNERLPFFITIPLDNGRPIPDTLDVRTHLSAAEGVVLAKVRLE